MMAGAAQFSSKSPVEALAFIDAYRWWLTCDCSFHQTADGGAGVDRHFVRSVGAVYAVNRTIPAKHDLDPENPYQKGKNRGQPRKVRDPSDPHAAALAAAVASFDIRQGETLGDRAKRLARLIDENAAAGKINASPISAMTKLLWFAKPDGWTMFDQYAALAVMAEHASSTAFMKNFYTVLDRRGFTRLVDNVRGALRHPFHPLLAERVIDKFLFIHGVRYSRAGKATADQDSAFESSRMEMALLNGFVNALPSDLRQQAIDQSFAIAETVSLSALLDPKVAA